MISNLRWPGVPKRNNEQSSPNDSLPKSIATVVRGFPNSVACSLTSRSVARTATSLMVSMRVVLPAANGPVTTIFSGRREVDR
jgi:hypothetical protein